MSSVTTMPLTRTGSSASLKSDLPSHTEPLGASSLSLSGLLGALEMELNRRSCAALGVIDRRPESSREVFLFSMATPNASADDPAPISISRSSSPFPWHHSALSTAALQPLLGCLFEQSCDSEDGDRLLILAPEERGKWCRLVAYVGHVQVDAADSLRSLRMILPTHLSGLNDPTAADISCGGLFDFVVGLVEFAEEILQCRRIFLSFDRKAREAGELAHSLLYVGFKLAADQRDSAAMYTMKYEIG